MSDKSDSGLQYERTSLSWRRTYLSFMLISLLVIKNFILNEVVFCFSIFIFLSVVFVGDLSIINKLSLKYSHLRIKIFSLLVFIMSFFIFANLFILLKN